MTGRWRYVFLDARTGAENGSFPLVGVSYDTAVGGAGSLTGLLPTLDEDVRAKDPWTATRERRTFLVVEQGDVLRWAGIVWRSKRTAGGGGLALTAATFDSWLEFCLLRDDLTFTDETAATIIGTLVAAAQDYPATSIGLTVTDGSPAGAVPARRDRTYAATDLATVGGLVANFTEVQSAVEYRVDVGRTPDGAGYTRTLTVGEPRVGRAQAVTGFVASYPGTLLSWADDTDGTRQANAVAAGVALPDWRWQSVTIDGQAAGGTFRLRYGTATTTPLAWDATLPAVEAALEALPGLSNRVTVTGAVGRWDVAFSLHPDKVLPLTVVSEALVGVPPGAVEYGSVSKDEWARLRRAKWRTRYLYAPAEAARLIKERITADDVLVHEDMSWRGMPRLAAAFNDELVTGFYTAHPSRPEASATSWPGNRSTVLDWLGDYIGAKAAEKFTAGGVSTRWVADYSLPDEDAPPVTLYPPAGVTSNPTVTATQDSSVTRPYFAVARAAEVGSVEVSAAGWPEQMTALSGGTYTTTAGIEDALYGALLDRLIAGRSIDGVALHPSWLDRLQVGDDLLLAITDPSYREWPEAVEIPVRVLGLSVTPAQGSTDTAVTATVVPVIDRLPPGVKLTRTLRKVLARLRALETP